MLTIGGYGDFLNHFVRKFLFILIAFKFDKLFKFKYLLQVFGINLLSYYLIKELRFCINPQNESLFLKLFILFAHSTTNFLCVLMLPPTNHRANLRLELLIFNSVLLSYLLTYPTIYLSVIKVLYGFVLLVSEVF
jgi:hypothetical protein